MISLYKDDWGFRVSENSQSSGHPTWPWASRGFIKPKRGEARAECTQADYRLHQLRRNKYLLESWTRPHHNFQALFYWTYTYISTKKCAQSIKSRDWERRESVNWKRMCLFWLLVRDGLGSQLASTSKAQPACLEHTCSRLNPALITQGVEGPLLQLRALATYPCAKGPWWPPLKNST